MLTQNLLADIGFEARSIDTARRHLDDIRHCADADYAVKWFDDGFGRKVPSLIVAFNLPETRHQPACAISLSSVSRSTGAWSLLEGDRLRAHVRRSVEHYLKECGVVLDQPALAAPWLLGAPQAAAALAS
jgi:hypothetical protein